MKHNGLHEFNTIEQRGCYLVKFSHGGHKLAAVFPKEIRIYESYNLKSYEKIDIGMTNAVTQIAFNHDDTILVAISKNSSFIKKYNVETGKQVGEGVVVKEHKFLNALYVREKRKQKKAVKNLLPS